MSERKLANLSLCLQNQFRIYNFCLEANNLFLMDNFLCQSLVLNSFNESGMTCLVEVIYNTTKNKPSPDLTPHGAGAVSFCSGLPRLGSVLIHVCLREIRNKYALITDSNHTNKEYLSSFGSDPP